MHMPVVDIISSTHCSPEEGVSKDISCSSHAPCMLFASVFMHTQHVRLVCPAVVRGYNSKQAQMAACSVMFHQLEVTADCQRHGTRCRTAVPTADHLRERACAAM